MGKISKEEFVKKYCQKSLITEQEFYKLFVVKPCDCGHVICKGWVAENVKSE